MKDRTCKILRENGIGQIPQAYYDRLTTGGQLTDEQERDCTRIVWQLAADIKAMNIRLGKFDNDDRRGPCIFTPQEIQRLTRNRFCKAICDV